MQSKLLLRSVIIAALLMGAVSSANIARAEVDTFGTGDGHSGAKTVSGTETINAYAPITGDVAAGATTISFGTVLGTGTVVAVDVVASAVPRLTRFV